MDHCARISKRMNITLHTKCSLCDLHVLFGFQPKKLSFCVKLVNFAFTTNSSFTIFCCCLLFLFIMPVSYSCLMVWCLLILLEIIIPGSEVTTARIIKLEDGWSIRNTFHTCINCLIVAGARYHKACYSKFMTNEPRIRKSGRPKTRNLLPHLSTYAAT